MSTKKDLCNFFRNHHAVVSIQGVEIDETSLWKLDPGQNMLVLEDEDQYQTHALDLQLFEKAK